MYNLNIFKHASIPSSYQELKFVINFPLIETSTKKGKKKKKHTLSHTEALPTQKNKNKKIKKNTKHPLAYKQPKEEKCISNNHIASVISYRLY
jgi:hypothetical protein